MEDATLAENGMLKQAGELVSALQDGDQLHAMQIVDEITRIREKYLFLEIGRMTRQLHDALIGLHTDSRMMHMTMEDIPDARERLGRVVGMTENAAHRTMAIVEEILPVCESFDVRVAKLQHECAEMAAETNGDERLKRIAEDLEDYFSMHQRKSVEICNGLREILIAQEYQDLTGQAIKHVIELVRRIENGLVEMIRASGSRVYSESAGHEKRELESIATQDDVDELLSSMGF